MTMEEFIKMYDGNANITIEGYCEEKEYDYYLLPDKETEDFSGNNPNHYIPACLEREPWWNEVKDRKVAHFAVTGGGIYAVELCIYLE